MSGSILDLSRGPPPGDRSADICIIGSGSAGGTAARVLAEAGHDVLVLEEGGDFTGTALTQRDVAMYDRLYMDQGNRATDDMSVSILQARVLGGGGVINGSDVEPIPDAVLHHWQRRHGLGDFAPERMAPYRRRALEDLSASRIRDDQLNRNNRIVREGAEKLGLRGQVLMHNRVGCQGLGTCLLGCPIHAKRNPRAVAIPAAVRAGARFFTRARVVRIEGAEEELKRIHVRSLDPLGRRETAETTIRARTVILAANAVGTAQLLLRSGIGNEHVGRHLTLQPQLPVTAIYDDEVRAFSGIPQAYAVTEHEREDHPEHGLWGFRIEPIMGTPGIVAAGLPFVGREMKETMQLYPRMAAALLLVPDAPSGSVEDVGSSRPRVRYAQREDHRARLREAIRVAARIYLATGARRVIVPTVRPLEIRSERDLREVDDLSFAPATAPLLSAHQQGTVRFGPSPKSGAADPEGRVFGTRGIYAFDSSGFPTSASTHTMAPILTVAHYLSDALLARLPVPR
ncbi:MAG: GMC family oxidoreductase N-terminal domain-containing protein [Myxococcota bacterium]